MEKKPIILLVMTVVILGIIFIFARNSTTPQDQQPSPEPDQSESQETLVVQTPEQLNPEAADSAEIEGTVMDISKNGNDEYATIQISNLINYNRNPDARFGALKINDNINAFLQWGSGTFETGIPDALYPSEVPGLKPGDNFRGNIAGCPKTCNSGKGWTLYLYKTV